MNKKPYKYYISSISREPEIVVTNEIKLSDDFIKLSWPKKKIIIDALAEKVKLPPVRVI